MTQGWAGYQSRVTDFSGNGNGAAGEAAAQPVDYATINIAFGALLAGVAYASARSEHQPLRGPELIPVGAATFALAKAISKERIGTWVREPFVDEENGRKPRGRRLRRAVGELVSCSRCMGAWSALGLVGLRTVSPEAGRTVTNVLAAAALNDWLQSGFKLLCEQTNATAKAAEVPVPAPTRD